MKVPIGGGVFSAGIKYSETGEGVSSIPVVMPVHEQGLSWDEIPVLGKYYSVKIVTRLGGRCAPSAADRVLEQEHELTLSVGIPDSDVNVLSHTFTGMSRDREEGEIVIVGDDFSPMPSVSSSSSSSSSSTSFVDSDGSQKTPGDDADTPRIRVLSQNVWNVNPPRYLHRDPKDRFRAYALRMLYLGELVRATDAGVIAFQEVRYDSTLGGFPGDAPQTKNPWAEGARSGPSMEADKVDGGQNPPDTQGVYGDLLEEVCGETQDPSATVHASMPAVARGNPYTQAVAWAVSSLWFNKTLNEISQESKYRERNAEKWSAVQAAPGWALYGGDQYPWGWGSGGNNNLSSSGGPYTLPPPPGPRSWSELQAAFLDHPHAQVRTLHAFALRSAAPSA